MSRADLFAPPPEGTDTITIEAEDIACAVAAAADQLEVGKAAIGFTLDKAHFLNSTGSTGPRDTVRIFAWARDESEVAAAKAAERAAPAADRSDRSHRADHSDHASGDTDSPVVGDTQAWMTELVKHLGLEGSVTASLSGNTVRVGIDVDNAGRLIGRRGRTLQAVEHLLVQSVGADFPDSRFRIDVARKDDDRRDRDDRGRGRDRDDRGRGRDRDDRGRGRGRDRDDRGGRDRDRSNPRETRALKNMAEKIAARVVETGKAEVVRKELNSFERRTVHLVAAEMEGVETRSIGDGPMKQIEFYPSGGSAGGEE